MSAVIASHRTRVKAVRSGEILLTFIPELFRSKHRTAPDADAFGDRVVTIGNALDSLAPASGEFSGPVHPGSSGVSRPGSTVNASAGADSDRWTLSVRTSRR